MSNDTATVTDAIAAGTTLTWMAIDKRLGRYATDAMIRTGQVVEAEGNVRGRPKRYTAKVDLTPDLAQDARKRAFSLPASEVASVALDGLDGLRQELQDWYDNLPESFQSGDKGQALEDAINQLDSAHGTLESLGNPADEGVEVVDAVMDYPQDGHSRGDRCSRLVDLLRQAAELYRERAKALRDNAENARKNDEAIQDAEAQAAADEAKADVAEEYATELDSAADEAEATEFPGMY